MNLNLQITHTEKSKDSHSSTEIWHIKNNILSYQETFSGRLSGQKPMTKTKNLSENNLISIEKILHENNLLISIEMPKYNEFHTPYTAILVDLRIEIKANIFHIQVYDTQIGMKANADYKNILVLQKCLLGLLDE
jgi:hypothetical protein